MKRALILIAAITVIAAAPPKAKLSLEAPAADETIAVGQQVEIDVAGLDDVDAAKVFAFPFDSASVRLVKVAEKSETPPWLTWGDVPKVLFSASASGQYLICLQSGNDWAMVTLNVQGPRPPPALVVEPSAPLDAAGPVGGPFSPPAATYTVTASGEWEAAASEPWVSVQPVGDKLLVVLGPEAYTLEAGTHEAVVTVACDGLTETRAVSLAVGEQPNPPPDPTPTPPTSLFGVVIEESSQRTPEQAIVLASPEVRKAFGEGQFLVIDKDAEDVNGQDPATVADYIERAKGLTLPVLFIVGADEAHKGKVYTEAKPLPGTPEELLNLVKQIKEGK